MAWTLGQINPFRYRSYYYDTETGLFYVGSRYYDPEIGRFINADVPEMAAMGLFTGDVLSTNLFAYCGNNPVMHMDPTGYWQIPTKSLGTLFMIIGLNPVAATLIGIGVYKLKMLLTEKFTLFIAKLGAFWGPVVQGALVVAAAITGIFILGPIAVGFFDAIVQRKKGVEITLKKTWWGMPYGINVGTY